MKQRKIAISLAIVGAIATPFVFGTYKMKPPSARTWLPINTELKENFVALLKRTNNCQEYEDKAQQLGKSENELSLLENCRRTQKALNEGGLYGWRPSTPLYLALNVAAAAVGFIVIFGMVYLLPALARRYWRWLNT